MADQTDKSAGPDGCWLWTGYVPSVGYPRITLGKKKLKPHRVAWETANGPISAEKFVCHRCDNPKCVNPAHLFVGSHDDNMADMVAKDRCSRKPTPDYVAPIIKGLPQAEYMRQWRRARRHGRKDLK